MTKLQLEQYEKIAEAILFAGGEPVDQKVVAQAMEVDEDAAVAVLESLKTKYEPLLVEDKKESIASISKLVQNDENISKVSYENRKNNIVVLRNNVSNGISNLIGNWQLCLNQAIKNVNQLVDYISKKVGRS